MKRAFSPAETRESLQKRKQWKTEHGMSCEKTGDCRVMVETAYKHFIAAETMKTSRGVPVERLDRGRRGLRVRLPRESGYASYEDLMLASEEQFAVLNGINEDGVTLIRDMVGKIITQLRPGIRLRLSADK